MERTNKQKLGMKRKKKIEQKYRENAEIYNKLAKWRLGK